MTTQSAAAEKQQSSDQSEPKGVSLFDFLRQTSQALKKVAPGEQWIRAEISQCRPFGRGHLSVELVEHNEAGQLSARLQAFIWSSNATQIQRRFVAGTGGSLTAGLKVMVRGSIDMHLTNNLRLVITDIDPSYTLGDIEANLKKIREALTEKGLIERNKRLYRPTEFCRVAIISPNGAAGLGDFQRDANILENHGLCRFEYFSAQFQGQGAVEGILIKMREVYALCASSQFDALCIIRGGGSATDLYWLNDFALARAICLMPIPVFTGIGHERDNTILDEVAHTCFDTPSKVVGHIRSTIQANAVQAAENYQFILLCAHRIVSSAEKDVEAVFAAIQRDAINATHVMDNKIEHLFSSIEPAAREWLYKGEQECVQHFQFIQSRCEADLIRISAEMDHYFESISVGVEHHLNNYEKTVEQFLQSIHLYVGMQIDTISRELDSLGREIVGLGPRATLNRGFAIVRSQDGKPIVSAEQARQYPELNVEFRDGAAKVKPT